MAAVFAWCYIAGLHWRNDGLWYQGDSPTHAINGLFWWDFLSRLPVDPAHFALGYYARYPTINPIAYPPVFYLLEGGCYHVFGVSPFTAKGLVLAFALFGCLYLMAWLRRWVSPVVGWSAVLFLLQPAIIIWANAVMLNVPCTVLAIAALYHWRRWLEDLTSLQVYWSAIFIALAVLTYLPTVVVVFIMLGWVLVDKKVAILRMPRLWIAGSTVLILLLPWMKLSSRWEPAYKQIALFQGLYPYWKFASWIYYVKQVPHLVTAPVLVLGLVGVLVGLQMKHWRREIRLAAIWFATCYVWFSLFSVKEQRYVLLLVPPVIILSAIGLLKLCKILGRLTIQRDLGDRLMVAALFLLIIAHLEIAYWVSVPRISGFQQVVSYVQKLSPNSRIFYGEFYHGVFTYYFRVQDPHFNGGVVRASKLLYATKIQREFGLIENVSSSQQVVDLIQHQCGCKYLVIERPMPIDIPAERYLRDALSSSEFLLVHSFPVETPNITDLDLYEYTGEVSVPQEYKFRFPTVGENAVFGVKPIPSEEK